MWEEILTITNCELYFKTEDDYSEVNHLLTSTSFILEPFGRNTAAAIAAAVLHVTQTFGDESLLLVLAADHLIADQAAFSTQVANAVELAKQGKIVTFGIQPDAPETGFGYIEANAEAKYLSQDHQRIGYDVLRFIRKPSQEKAQEYLDSGRFFYDSGMFLFLSKNNARGVGVALSGSAKSDTGMFGAVIYRPRFTNVTCQVRCGEL